jgi:hypothetical protein
LSAASYILNSGWYLINDQKHETTFTLKTFNAKDVVVDNKRRLTALKDEDTDNEISDNASIEGFGDRKSHLTCLPNFTTLVDIG